MLQFVIMLPASEHSFRNVHVCGSPVGEEVLSAVACLQAAGSVAYLGQRAAVQTEAVAEVLASFRKEGAGV